MFITIGNFMQCSPRAQVAPPEIGDVYINIIRLLENTVIDRDIGAKRETFIDEFFLVERVEKIFPLVEFLVDIGEIFLEPIHDAIHAPQKDTGIPNELTTVDKLFRQLVIGLLGERLYFKNTVLLLFVRLDIAIACFGPTGLNAQR